ncbi:hypothetical protein Scep_017734 [Stephania cephalantha]|uniref:Uncharacterized protein n=1 Tax=Stephania cephalantha TaxID=152367 RepID=A0AAP0IS26_9MAGN
MNHQNRNQIEPRFARFDRFGFAVLVRGGGAAAVRRALRDGPTAVRVLERRERDSGCERGEGERDMEPKRERRRRKQRERAAPQAERGEPRRGAAAARRGARGELQRRTNGATLRKARTHSSERWRRLGIGGGCGSGGPATREAACVGWCGRGRVGTGTTPATLRWRAERREEPGGRGDGGERREERE